MLEDGQNNPTGGDESEERQAVADVNDNILVDDNTMSDNPMTKTTMPSTWFFHGFIVFALRGPIVLLSESSGGGEDYRCELILSSIAVPKTKDGKLLQGRLYGSRKQLPVKENEGDDEIRILSNASKKRRSSKVRKHLCQNSEAGQRGQEVSLSNRL